MVAVSVAAVACCAPAAFADGQAPWWGLTSGAQPTNLSAGSGKNDVQTLRVSATKGDYLLVAGGLINVVPFNATTTVIREDLEAGAPASAPPSVTEEASGEEDTRLYKIVYPSEEMEPPFVTAEKFFVEAFGGELLEGGNAEVVATQVEKGEASANKIVIYVENLGDAPTTGKVSVSDQLPAGLIPTGISAHAGGTGPLEKGPVSCELKKLTCTFVENFQGEPGVLPPFEVIEVDIRVQVTAGATDGELNTASVFGGGVSGTKTTQQRLAVGTAQRFGIEDFSLTPEQDGGPADTQAGSHPFQLTTDFTLNSQTADREGFPRASALTKDIVAELPPGLVGNTTAFAQCTDAQFAQQVNVGNEIANACPADSAVGAINLTFNLPGIHLSNAPAPIFNMVPRPGEPVRFGFKVSGIVSVFLDTSVRTGKDYGVTVSSLNIPQGQWLLAGRLTIWGVPGDPAHDGQRGWVCLMGYGGPSACPAVNQQDPPPFLSMPTSCAEPFESRLSADSWGASAKPAEVADPVSYRLPEAIDGCNHLPFSPSIKVKADGSAASTPTGLNVDVHVPQDSVLKAESLSESAVKDISVTLPEGVAIDPSGGNGLEGCSEGLVGFTGFAPLQGEQTATFTSTLPEPLQPGVNFCPDAAKVGTVKIKVPIIANPLEGSVYLASQTENPFGSLIAMYIVARDPISGVLVKIPGEVHLSDTGQVTGTFHNSPQAPLEDAELHFFGGERAPLATPSRCGTYTTNATFTPWSGTSAVQSTSSFDITSGPNGSPCPGQHLPFSPTLTAGTTNIQAGALSTLRTTVGREDGNQDISSVQLRMPPGVSGILAGVKLCPEAQANAGLCGPESLIGETTISAGLGSDPVSVTGGRVYITEKYRGAPYGLSIVNPVKAGPFDLENTPANHPPCDCVVVRATIEVDPITAQLQITTDTDGPYAIPHEIEGIPVQIKHVNVTITRQGFTFNPSNCSPMSIGGTISSDEGASSPVSVPFQVTNCALLGFKPSFKVSTSGKTSRQTGASLHVKLAYPKAPFGSQTNIKSVKVDLPKQLPSQLRTLQKACPAETFNANPAACDPESRIGEAKATTPLLPVPLTGPVYFVSYGGAQFPELVIVLSGYGTTVKLHAETYINKAGITSSTFRTIPDVPVGTFELTLPQGKYSALAAPGNKLCQAKLAMPTIFTAQNGAVIKQSTPIGVTGCAKHVAKKKKRKKAARKHK